MNIYTVEIYCFAKRNFFFRKPEEGIQEEPDVSCDRWVY